MMLEQPQSEHMRLQISQHTTESNHLTTLTLNVLFGTRNKERSPGFLQKYHIKYSDERFNHIVEKIKRLNPDVITFNQVTLNFISHVNQNKFLAKNYSKSQSDYNDKTKYDIEGNLILVKKSLKNIQFSKIYLKSHNQPVHVASFTQNSKRIAVASVHLLAFAKNAEQRQEQLREIIEYFSQSQICQNLDLIVLQGDMNFHSESQNSILEKYSIRDCWLEQFDLSQNPGYTFDAQQNPMINQLYWGFQQRRMRLDRVFTIQNKDDTKFEVKEMQICFNEPIHAHNKVQGNRKFMGWFQSIFSFIWDVFGKNWKRNKEDYLFPSDHFGLLTTFKIS